MSHSEGSSETLGCKQSGSSLTESCPTDPRPVASAVDSVGLPGCLFRSRNLSAYTSHFPSGPVANQDHNKPAANALQMKECQESKQICFPPLRSFPEGKKVREED